MTEDVNKWHGFWLYHHSDGERVVIIHISQSPEHPNNPAAFCVRSLRNGKSYKFIPLYDLEKKKSDLKKLELPLINALYGEPF